DYYDGFMRRLTGSTHLWAIAPPVPGQPDDTDWGDGFDTVSDAMNMPDGCIWYCRQFTQGDPNVGEIRRIRYASTTSVHPGAGRTLQIATPVPTPTRDRVTLSWSQPDAGPVRLVVHDVSGRTVRVLEDGAVLGHGAHEHTWDGRTASGAMAPAGLYFA